MNLPMDGLMDITTTLCASCEEPVTVAQNGRVLTPAPTRLGIYDPVDGEPLTTTDITARIRATDLAGHSPHRCPTGQTTLFDDAQEAS
jgi:hypothetical protein